jgi:hypothetical protein
MLGSFDLSLQIRGMTSKGRFTPRGLRNTRTWTGYAQQGFVCIDDVLSH